MDQSHPTYEEALLGFAEQALRDQELMADVSAFVTLPCR